MGTFAFDEGLNPEEFGVVLGQPPFSLVQRCRLGTTFCDTKKISPLRCKAAIVASQGSMCHNDACDSDLNEGLT